MELSKDLQLSVEYLPHIKRLYVYTDHEEIGMKTLEDLSRAFDMPSPETRSTIEDVSVFTFSSVNLKIQAPSNPWKPLYTASEVGKISSIECSSCGQKLLKNSPLLMKDLPSTYWMELVDCWSCHQSEFAVITTKVKQGTSAASTDIILPKQGTVHNGLDFLLVSLEDLEPHDCVIEETVDASCKRLMKHAATVVDENGTIFGPCSPMQCLVQRLYEIMQAHTTQSFLLTNDKVRLMFEIINWDVLSFDPINGILSPAIKVKTRLIDELNQRANMEIVEVDWETIEAICSHIDTTWPVLDVDDAKIVLFKI